MPQANKLSEFDSIVIEWDLSLRLQICEYPVNQQDEIWSNGRLPSVKHRVQCYEENTRLSIVFFVFGPNDRAIEQPPELVDSQHPRLYNPIKFADYRLLRLSNNLFTGAFELLRINS
ncbi:hypothetical protein CsSME_00018824 [Camellia sinensis var. sinensis]